MRISNRDLWQASLAWGGTGTELGAHDPGPRRTNKHPEQGVLNAIMTVLRLHSRVGLVWRMNSGAYRLPDGRFVRFGFVGCPDILGVFRENGRLFAIECKADKGRVSPAQAVVLERFRELNVVCGVARSIEDAIRIVEGQ